MADWRRRGAYAGPPNGAAFAKTSVVFTAPASGVADISGALWNARWTDDVGDVRTGAWAFYVNDVLQDSGLLAEVAKSTPEPFGLNDIALIAGQTVRLELYRADSAVHGDFIGVDLKVDLSEVPLPAGLPLFAAGLGLIGLLARRRNKSRLARAVA